jgi:Domain of unknown function (DUF6438)
MKSIIFITTILFAVQVSRANEIDDLKTAKEVQKFLIKKVSGEWKGINFFEGGFPDTSEYGKYKFFKIDLDNNGLTDLIINGKYFLAVTDEGNGHYKSHFIDRGAFSLASYTLVNILYKEKVPLLIITGYNESNGLLWDTTKKDTLVYKFNGFAEYNSTVGSLKIERIKFLTTGCFGTCPMFKMEIDNDRKAIYNAIEYNDKKGTFAATIDTASYNNIIETLNCIKLTSLKDDYEVRWTDDQHVTLEITFNNGLTKSISDYGAIGTFGLANLYDQIFLLRQTQTWK